MNNSNYNIDQQFAPYAMGTQLSGPQPTQPKSEVSAQCEMLGAAMARTHMLLETLQERLASVLLPLPPTQKNEEKLDCSVGSEVGKAFALARSHAETANDQLSTIIGRLAIG